MKISLFHRIWRRFHWEWRKYADKLYKWYYFVPNVLSDQETVDFIVANNASMARFGDGELNVITGRDLNFQHNDVQLGARLEEVFRGSYDNLLICIPDVFKDLGHYNQVEQNFWHSHLYYNRSKWYKFLRKNAVYGNTFVSRFYSMEYDKQLASHRVLQLKRLWDNRDIVFLEGCETKMGIGNDLFNNAKTIKRIVCPAKDAFSKYDVIIEKAKQLSPEVLVILALGPTATVLAAELHLAGYQALDLGHIDIEYEWYLMGAKEKLPICGKFTNEAVLTGKAEKETMGILEANEYEKQIICRIS